MHVLQFASNVLLGLYFFLTENVSLKEIRAEAIEVGTYESAPGRDRRERS